MSIRRNNQLENVRKVALVGFIGPNQAMLEYCFSSVVDCELVNASSAAIIIVNGDQASKDADVQQQINEKFADTYKIVISIRDLSWDGFVLLKKPHNSDDLLNIVRAFDLESESAGSMSGDSKPSEQQVRPRDVDFYRGGEYSKKRKSEALKQKLMRGNLVVSASDRLVHQLEEEIKAQEAELRAKLEAEKLEQTKVLLAKKKALKLKELKLEKLKQERLEQARIEQERLEQERIEQERLEQERLKQERLEQERLEQKRAEQERLKAERIESKRLEKERIEKARLTQERINKARLEKLRIEKARKDKEKLKETQSNEAADKTELQVDDLDIEALDADRQRFAKHELTPEEVVQRCGNSGDVDLSKREERRRIFFSAEDSLLAKIIEAVALAKKMEQSVEITGLPGEMYYFPEEQVFYSTFTDDFLNQLALTRFGYQELDIKAQSEFELEGKSKHLAEDAQTLIWKVAIWTARGRLFNGMDPEKNMQLSTQPDFVRFLPLPSGEEISEVWAGHSLSALDVVRILDVPQRVVFSFMSGAYSLGWFQE